MLNKITESNVDPWEFLEAVGSDNNNPTQCLKSWESRGEEEFAWDDVNNIALPLELVEKAQQEEMSYMKGKIFKVVKKSEAWRITGKAPLSTKWVDTDKTHGIGVPVIRSRWLPEGQRRCVQRYTATPLEMMRFIMSRQATHRKDGRERKSMYLDKKKAHVIPLFSICVAGARLLWESWTRGNFRSRSRRILRRKLFAMRTWNGTPPLKWWAAGWPKNVTTREISVSDCEKHARCGTLCKQLPGLRLNQSWSIELWQSTVMACLLYGCEVHFFSQGI